MTRILISIVVVARNAERTIERCINSILSLGYDNYEVIVVDDGSSDNTADILRKYASKIKVISHHPGIGPSAARNMAAKQAKGEYLAFTDADCVVDKFWLKELLSGFIESDVAAVGGRQEVPDDESKFGRSVSAFIRKTGLITDYMRKVTDKMESVGHNPSCNVMYKKEVFLKEGGFLEGLWPGEDVELDYRLKKKGYKIYFNPRAIVYHYRPDNLKSFWKMMSRYGWAQGILVRRCGLFRKIHIFAIAVLVVIVVLCFGFAWNRGVTIIAAGAFLIFIYAYFSFEAKTLFLAITGVFFWFLAFLKGIVGFKK